VTAILGIWDVTIKTPIGSLVVEYMFTAGDDGLRGVATLRGDTTALDDIAVEGSRVTWRQSITKPMRLHLEFDVTVDGDQLTGHSRAGRLPRSAVSGARRG
jgi:hypothetical protein